MKRRRKFHHSRRIFVLSSATVISAVFTANGLVAAEDTAGEKRSAEQKRSGELRDEMVSQGLAFLADQAQSEEGMFSARVGPGVTALAITGALKNGRGVDDPMNARRKNARSCQASGTRGDF